MINKGHDGRMAFEELLGLQAVQPSSLDAVLSLPTATDPALLKIAQELEPSDPYTMYERLGGFYRLPSVKLAEGPSQRPLVGGLKPGVVLFPHQREAVDKVIAKDGNLLLSHPVGSGKTLTAIAAFEELRKRGKAERALVVTPASLRTNFLENGIKKFTNSRGAIFGNAQEAAQGTHVTTDKPDPHAQYHIVSYELFRTDPKKYIDAAKADTVIYDELHRAKNEGVLTSKAVKDARQYHRNFIGMTGSIVSNTPADIVPLVDAMTDGKHLLGSKSAFEARFVQTKENGTKVLRQPQVLRALLSPYVHHVDPETLNTSAPKKIIETVAVEMSPYQRDLYKFIKKELDPLTELRLKAGASKLNNAQLNDMFSKLIRLRQVSNSIHTMDKGITPEQSAEQTPKIKRILDDVQEHIKETPDAQVAIHTNLVHGGVDVITAGLKARGIDHAVFIGKGNAGVTEKSRQYGVKEFQEGKKKVIVLSAAGGEGLDLPNTTFMAMVDGHFNPERINQAEARGVRAGGLSHRDPDKRQVLIRRYVSVFPEKGMSRAGELASNIWLNVNPSAILNRLSAGGPALFNPFTKERTTDQWVYSVAANKGRLNRAVHESIKQGSVEIEPATHEEFEEWLLDGFIKEAGFSDKVVGAANKLLDVAAEHPMATFGLLGAAGGALLGGTPPRSAMEAKQDPNAPLRNRLGATVGGALGGVIAGAPVRGVARFLGRKVPLSVGLLNSLSYVPLGASAGLSVAALAAPPTKVPQSAVEILGKRTDYSDKALFEEYWKRFGKELEEKGVEGKLSDEEAEARFVNALRDIYTAGKNSDKGPLRTEAQKEKSRSRYLLGAALAAPIAAIGPAVSPLLIQHEMNKALGLPGVKPSAVALQSLPGLLGLLGPLAVGYRKNFIDPGVYVSSKTEARKRSKFTDAQLRDLLRGKVVEEIKTKAHVIK